MKVIIVLLAAVSARSELMEVVNQWNLLNFDFPYDNRWASMFR